jgi:hypothetical protein
LQSQEASLVRVNDQLDTFSETILTIQVHPTGSTPKKQVFKPLPELCSTRDHEEIKSEVREAASNAQCTEQTATEEGKEILKSPYDLVPQSPFDNIENLSPGAANVVVSTVDLKSSAGKELILSKSIATKAARTSKSSSSHDSDTASVSSAGALRVRSRVV